MMVMVPEVMHQCSCCPQPCMHGPNSTCHSECTVQVQEIDVPEPKEGQALIKMILR